MKSTVQILKPIVYFFLLRFNLHHFKLLDFNTAVLLHLHSIACFVIIVHKAIKNVSDQPIFIVEMYEMRQNFRGST